MVQDISEQDAGGEIREIFAEVRSLWGVSYVSAVHRYMASQPGLLEWAWAAVAPEFRSGRAQEAAWAATSRIAIADIAPISQDALAVWGANASDLETLHVIARNFTRVAPVNMMFAALLRRVINEGRAARAEDAACRWRPADTLPDLPAMVAIDTLPPPERALISRFASNMDGSAFVPGLYRMIAHWPGVLAHFATVLPETLQSEATLTAYQDIRQRIDAAADQFNLTLPTSTLTRDAPSSEQLASFQAIAETYRKTSPEMIVAGGLILRALPEARQANNGG